MRHHFRGSLFVDRPCAEIEHWSYPAPDRPQRRHQSPSFARPLGRYPEGMRHLVTAALMLAGAAAPADTLRHVYLADAPGSRTQIARLTSAGGDRLLGTLHEVDMNLLAAPPEPDELRPPGPRDLTSGDPDSHRLPRLVTANDTDTLWSYIAHPMTC